MKAKGLQVGDWIQALCEHYEPYEVVLEKSQITHINRETIYVANGNIFFGEDGEMRRYSVAEPIPLTDEILEKNGFSYIAGHYCNGISDSYVKDGFVLGRIHKSFYIYCAMRHVIIKYVHELQHALRLCGLNEMADNLKLE